MLPRIEATISSSLLSKPFSWLAVLEDIVPASCCTLKPKEVGAPLRSTQGPDSHLSAQTCLRDCRPGPAEEGAAESKSCPPLKRERPCDWLQGLRASRGLVIAEGFKGA